MRERDRIAPIVMLPPALSEVRSDLLAFSLLSLVPEYVATPLCNLRHFLVTIETVKDVPASPQTSGVPTLKVPFSCLLFFQIDEIANVKG